MNTKLSNIVNKTINGLLSESGINFEELADEDEHSLEDALGTQLDKVTKDEAKEQDKADKAELAKLKKIAKEEAAEEKRLAKEEAAKLKKIAKEEAAEEKADKAELAELKKTAKEEEEKTANGLDDAFADEEATPVNNNATDSIKNLIKTRSVNAQSPKNTGRIDYGEVDPMTPAESNGQEEWLEFPHANTVTVKKQTYIDRVARFREKYMKVARLNTDQFPKNRVDISLISPAEQATFRALHAAVFIPAKSRAANGQPKSRPMTSFDIKIKGSTNSGSSIDLSGFEYMEKRQLISAANSRKKDEHPKLKQSALAIPTEMLLDPADFVANELGPLMGQTPSASPAKVTPQSKVGDPDEQTGLADTTHLQTINNLRPASPGEKTPQPTAFQSRSDTQKMKNSPKKKKEFRREYSTIGQQWDSILTRRDFKNDGRPTPSYKLPLQADMDYRARKAEADRSARIAGTIKTQRPEAVWGGTKNPARVATISKQESNLRNMVQGGMPRVGAQQTRKVPTRANVQMTVAQGSTTGGGNAAVSSFKYGKSMPDLEKQISNRASMPNSPKQFNFFTPPKEKVQKPHQPSFERTGYAGNKTHLGGLSGGFRRTAAGAERSRVAREDRKVLDTYRADKEQAEARKYAYTGGRVGGGYASSSNVNASGARQTFGKSNPSYTAYRKTAHGGSSSRYGNAAPKMRKSGTHGMSSDARRAGKDSKPEMVLVRGMPIVTNLSSGKVNVEALQVLMAKNGWYKQGYEIINAKYHKMSGVMFVMFWNGHDTKIDAWKFSPKALIFIKSPSILIRMASKAVMSQLFNEDITVDEAADWLTEHVLNKRGTLYND